MVSLYAQMFIELPNKKANISFDPLQCIPFSLKGAQSFITQQRRKCVARLSSKTFSLFFAFALCILYTPNRYLRERTKKMHDMLTNPIELRHDAKPKSYTHYTHNVDALPNKI